MYIRAFSIVGHLEIIEMHFSCVSLNSPLSQSSPEQLSVNDAHLQPLFFLHCQYSHKLQKGGKYPLPQASRKDRLLSGSVRNVECRFLKRQWPLGRRCTRHSVVTRAARPAFLPETRVPTRAALVRMTQARLCLVPSAALFPGSPDYVRLLSNRKPRLDRTVLCVHCLFVCTVYS